MKRTKIFGLIVGLTLVCGCGGGGGGETENAEVPKTPVTPVVNNAETLASVEVLEVTNNLPETPVELETIERGPSADDFKNPFFTPTPENIEIVEDVPQQTESNAEVQLLGFINVTQLKAIIKIEDNVYTAVEGTSYDQVTVVKIDESSVTLKRNGREWKESLFARPSPSAVANARLRNGRNTPFPSENANPTSVPIPGGSGFPNIPELPGVGGNGGFPELPGIGDIPGAVKGLFGG